jgi:hypothetical protein
MRFSELLTIKEGVMNCKNILIVTFGQDAEITQVKKNLINRYGDRTLNEVNAIYESNKQVFKAAVGSKKNPPVEGDTGIYAISHGLQGFISAVDNTGLHSKGHVDEFVNWLFTLAGQGFKIKKICFLACRAVDSTKVEVRDALPLDAQATLSPEERAMLPLEDQARLGVFVQHVCGAISKHGDAEKLKGLMVAGYTHSVTVSVAKNVKTPIKTYHTVKNPEKDRISAGNRMRPMFEGKDKFEAFKALEGQDKVKALQALKVYKESKRVFIFEGGAWRMGQLWEYTDKDDWKKLLKF